MVKYNSTILLIVTFFFILAIPVYGYAGMAGDNSGTTQSDQNIVLLQDLIEVDAAQLESQNRILVRETLIYKNIGDNNFSGTLRTWVPEGLEGLKVGKVSMMMGGNMMQQNAIQNGNIISWQDYILSNNPLPPLYAVEYTISSEAEGALVKSKHFSKKIVFPTLINKIPMSFIVKVTKGNGENIVIIDEKGSNISSSEEPIEEGNSILYKWENPGFKEINIDIFPAIDTIPIQTSNQIQTDKQIKELQERLNQTEAKQAQQEKRLSWLEEKMKLILQWLRSIIGI